MKLRDYLKSTSQTVDDFAVKHGWGKSQVRKWVYEQRTPSVDDIARIEDITGRKVGLRDWLLVPAGSTPVDEPQGAAA